MSDRTETHEDFSWPAAETPWAEGRSEVHTASAPPRHSDRPHPELRRASLICHLEIATKLIREEREDEALTHVKTFLRLFGEA